MSEWSAFLLGVIQGVTEWIPVSSQGIVTLAAAWPGTLAAADAIAIGLWLHVGTALSAMGALRKEIARLVRETTAAPRRISPTVAFLLVSTAMTGVLGIPAFLLLGEAADRPGSAVLLIIGIAMIPTAWIGRRREWGAGRGLTDVTLTDAVLAGAAQGIAVVPGLSRTGLTVAALLGRGIGHHEVVTLSVLMGIPASLGAGALALIVSDTVFGVPAIIGMITAAAVGMAAIRTVLAWAGRVRLAPFIAVTGAVVTAGALPGVLA